ncbi:unnamed protein product [Anisakis simplex]|uniref:Phosphatidylinositol 4-kinase type 2 n=1 Tax=Anisakis simplex TaxID=6269 RepID=A0A0M3KCQ6_ANISI|nr:unnamed protein product [Anisakis simplex]
MEDNEKQMNSNECADHKDKQEEKNEGQVSYHRTSVNKGRSANDVRTSTTRLSRPVQSMTSKTGSESDFDSDQSKSWSVSLPSTSLKYDPAWTKRIGEYAALEDMKTSKAEDMDFNDNLRRCCEAMQAGVHPLRIQSGSSGSYFIRDKNGEIIAVFKPKSEEPFAPLNPKWPKFFQRILCFCCFGRACLIPNNGYLSETGASLVDEKLELHIVPKTRIVKLASPAFFYSRSCFKTNSPKPKDGSYQVFVNGYVSASDIIPEWSKDAQSCPLSAQEANRFKILFQKMCILDYIIRNTDRHMDNWLIKSVIIPNIQENANNMEGFLIVRIFFRYRKGQVLEIAAIDNGLAFPVKHPETASRLRTFPFGWAHLSWAKLPWDEDLRSNLLALLTPEFVQTLSDDIKMLFKYDKEVNRFLKYNQLRVMRGQVSACQIITSIHFTFTVH